MKLRTLLSLAARGDLALLLRLQRLLAPVYRASFLAAASRAGVLRACASGPQSFERLAETLAPDPEARDALAAWLELGVELGELARTPAGYVLHGALARRLADRRADAFAAFLEEAATLHTLLLLRTPERTARGRLFSLADQEGGLIARSSRALEPVVFEAVDAFVPAQGRVRLLEIGCGSGTYIRRAAQRNANLTALGLELQPEVADAARENLRAWGIAPRASVEVGDVRARTPEPVFDLVTLHNNIYYFPVASRVALLRHVRGFLEPGGRLLVTTGCQGGTLAMRALDLWAAATEGCGRLPTPPELVGQLEAAGFAPERERRLIPRESYYAFVARRSNEADAGEAGARPASSANGS